jgi:putative membrane protein
MQLSHSFKAFLVGICTLSFAGGTSVPPTFAQSSPTQDSSMQPSPIRGGSQSSALNDVDRQFVIKAAQSDMTEIQTSQLALKRTQNPKVKQFAQDMIREHAQSSSQLKPLAKQKGIALPKSIGSESQLLVDRLTKFSGAKFDQAYIEGQTQGHTKTQAAYQEELNQGQDADVKAFASEVLPIVTAHLGMAQNLAAER